MADNDKTLENETEKIDEAKVTVEDTDKKKCALSAAGRRARRER